MCKEAARKKLRDFPSVVYHLIYLPPFQLRQPLATTIGTLYEGLTFHATAAGPWNTAETRRWLARSTRNRCAPCNLTPRLPANTARPGRGRPPRSSQCSRTIRGNRSWITFREHLCRDHRAQLFSFLQQSIPQIFQSKPAQCYQERRPNLHPPEQRQQQPTRTLS